METGLTTSSQHRFVGRAAPIACGVALCGAAAFVAANDPAAPGARFPSCPFHDVTGLWCPGCGLTRGTHEFLHGHIGAALSYNVFTPLVLLAVVGAWIVWLRTSWGAAPPRLPARTGRWLAVVMPVVVIGYGVVRNIPIAPLRALAP